MKRFVAVMALLLISCGSSGSSAASASKNTDLVQVTRTDDGVMVKNLSSATYYVKANLVIWQNTQCCDCFFVSVPLKPRAQVEFSPSRNDVPLDEVLGGSYVKQTCQDMRGHTPDDYEVIVTREEWNRATVPLQIYRSAGRETAAVNDFNPPSATDVASQVVPFLVLVYLVLGVLTGIAVAYFQKRPV